MKTLVSYVIKYIISNKIYSTSFDVLYKSNLKYACVYNASIL